MIFKIVMVSLLLSAGGINGCYGAAEGEQQEKWRQEPSYKKRLYHLRIAVDPTYKTQLVKTFKNQSINYSVNSVYPTSALLVKTRLELLLKYVENVDLQKSFEALSAQQKNLELRIAMTKVEMTKKPTVGSTILKHEIVKGRLKTVETLLKKTQAALSSKKQSEQNLTRG